MKLRPELLRAIETFLGFVSAKTRKRGLVYQRQRCVLKLTCVTPDQSYSAVVRGGEDYTVSLEFADHAWSADCSCPVGYNCKHAVAALFELREQVGADLNAWAGKADRPPNTQLAHVVPQPPPSPICMRLRTQLGRELNPAEAGFIRKVQQLHANAGLRPLTDYDLGLVAGNHHIYNTWQRLELWIRPPRDDFEFWLYVAWELRRRKAAWPGFMDGITDLNLIAAEMNDRERAKQILQWKHWLQQVAGPAPAAESGTLELRLAIHPTEARLQWCQPPATGFADFKSAHGKRFAEQLDYGSLQLTSESLPIWGALFKPWHYESWWTLAYASANARPVLNRLLRLGLPPERIVAAAGQPLARVTEPFRLELRPPENCDGDYELTLVTAAGSPPPKIFCTFAGQPTLYLTESGLFTGPAAETLATELGRRIPAPALETTEGVRFLQTAGVTLPDPLARRVRPVPVLVTLSCELQILGYGSKTEDIVIQVVAQAPEMTLEKFTVGGWVASPGKNLAEQKLQSEPGVIPVPDRSAQRHFPRVLEALGVKWSGYGEWTLRLNKKTPELLVAWLESLPPDLKVRLDPELATLRDEPVSGSVSLDVTEAAMDWFDLKVVLQVGDPTLTPEELKLLLNARGGYVRLGRKGWRRLHVNLTPEDDDQLARLGLHARDFSAEPQRFHALQLADAAAKKFLAPERMAKIQRRVSELKTRLTPALPSAIRAEMRPYQTDGYHFLAYLTANHFGGVLADDMGLGKTLQTLAWLAWLRENGSEHGSGEKPAAPLPSLVVCPKSVTDNWRTEAERFYACLRVRIWRGEPAAELAAAREMADLIVLNYAQLRQLSPAIAEVPWQAAILDEAQSIKNPDSQTAQAAGALKADQRLALTGTPIENRLLDLWSILSFAMPGALGNRASFLRRFNAQDDPLARRRLAARVRPFLLRRTKTQVAKDLPDRIEEDLLCEMEGEQQTLYRAELKRAQQLLLGVKSKQQLNAERFNLLTALLRLRQICCHPALVDDQLREAESAKVTALEDLLEPLMEEGHKVLVFSQFVTLLELLRTKVKQREWPHYFLAGDTEDRGELVQEFQAAKGGAVFLISLKAGGFGLNLTAASYVVLFDPWWNPAVENQAIDRTHRIGQTSKVIAYRLLMRESIEQKIRLLQKKKAALMDEVLGEERFAQSLTLEDLRFLLAA
jgi:hypothetical protein